mgnify:FL=1
MERWFMAYNLEKFKKGLDDLQIHLDEKQMGQFLTYYELLVETNKVMNLTAITEFDEVIEKHFLDSLSLCRVKDLRSLENQLEAYRILDLGTGAGFPGIPLKIAFPKLQIVLADSLNKRIRFLQEVIDTLGLKDVTAVHGRAEEMGRNTLYREQFDLCVSRAVANLSSLSEYCLPFVKMGGAFISYKSGEVDEEAAQAKRAIYLLGGEVKDIYKFDLFDQKRSFVVIEKERKTPKAYPRKAGTPTKEPLQ